MDQVAGAKQIVLCFDGTGYEFRGDDTDSNVLKIYRMLDRNDKNHLHYYQPGIGMNTGFIFSAQDFKPNAKPMTKWYTRAKDAAFGSTFEEHVMAGYRYLMRSYTPGDNIYFIGFSRGAYVARLLTEMLDHIGLLESGNEGKVRFLWSVFSKWGQCHYSRNTSQEEKEDVFQYMKALRETFCRPVTQIDFLGLFDTVNSIPHFEMNRNRFLYPYSTKTTAKIIRHAVSIDEHRAKFRQDLLANSNPISVRAGRLRIYKGQSIEEVWFPGCHADIGGGLRYNKKEDWALSHVPLVWMVTEAQRAGLQFDPEKLKQFWCFDESEFEYALWKASTNGELHDFLQYHHGAKWPVVLSWKMIEYLPLRRVLLQRDQSWRVVRWPPPLGERRDIPADAKIHVSAIRRLKTNSYYRPKNLIRGGREGKRNEKHSTVGHEIEEW
ncbi:hypothetical protein ASPACDRAFT_52900 [Aspergillus aculeatus ATCC 16872]|uniref:T6SS Phospholipase effector Tle1-like catalytic domain-containing protein n=1 Tax=Aspergillus aculeatus (strain ATCC 16872 / CBS 172.66 / WB 5094) TaxID=690307 RepID=A0A1L9WR58_ASPA1|nr:uncharacterized protein ASPACDRAFT_52900 [Aspergillus aculeatus ATCC 16872]OJJ98656.1 hypothetical protein ASPACDRAFT_52900 [Aspergillus aculeatus ATCC 16872]